MCTRAHSTHTSMRVHTHTHTHTESLESCKYGQSFLAKRERSKTVPVYILHHATSDINQTDKMTASWKTSTYLRKVLDEILSFTI